MNKEDLDLYERIKADTVNDYPFNIENEVKKQMKLDLQLYKKGKVNEEYMLQSIWTYKQYGYEINELLNNYFEIYYEKNKE